MPAARNTCRPDVVEWSVLQGKLVDQVRMRAMVMKIREFLAEVAELVRSQLPDDLRDFKALGPTGSLLKLHYGDPRIHYEVWLQRRAGRVEVGLHFEGEPAGNTRYLKALASCSGQIRHELGPDLELEQWTSSWTRAHRTLQLEALDEDFALEVSQHLSSIVRVLQPLVLEIQASGSQKLPAY